MKWQHLKDLPQLVLLGGTFDPIHNGHIQLAHILFNIFKAPIIFMPTNGLTPYKPSANANKTDRTNMLKLAIHANKNFIFESFEVEQKKYTCTYNTLSSIRRELGYKLPIHFFIGSDSLDTLDTWDNWQSLFNLTNFVVAKRQSPKPNMMSQQLQAEFNQRKTYDLSSTNNAHGKIYLLDTPYYPVSSTMIRDKIAHKQNITELVDKDVAQYIKKHNLYTI